MAAVEPPIFVLCDDRGLAVFPSEDDACAAAEAADVEHGLYLEVYDRRGVRLALVTTEPGRRVRFLFSSAVALEPVELVRLEEAPSGAERLRALLAGCLEVDAPLDALVERCREGLGERAQVQLLVPDDLMPDAAT